MGGTADREVLDPLVSQLDRRLGKDGWITPDKVAQFDKALTEAGVRHEFHAYDADHAFANPSGGRYNGEAAKDAWEKTRQFLAANLKR